MGKSVKQFDIPSLRRGEKKAYENIYNKFFGMLYHFCLQYMDDEMVAEEIVQDSFMKLWEIRSTLTDQFNINNFLYTITKNNCLNQIRNKNIALRHQKNIMYLEMQFNYDTLERLGDYIQFEELRNNLENAIKNLPDSIRETFILSRYESLRYNEIAQKQNISIKTVEARISKALRILRTELKDYLHIIYLITTLLS